MRRRRHLWRKRVRHFRAKRLRPSAGDYEWNSRPCRAGSECRWRIDPVWVRALLTIERATRPNWKRPALWICPKRPCEHRPWWRRKWPNPSVRSGMSWRRRKNACRRPAPCKRSLRNFKKKKEKKKAREMINNMSKEINGNKNPARRLEKKKRRGSISFKSIPTRVQLDSQLSLFNEEMPARLWL